MSTAEETQPSTPKWEEIKFHQPQLLVRNITDTGKILPKKYTGLSAKQQRELTRTIKRSRNMLLSK